MDTRGSVTNSNLPGSSYTVGELGDYYVIWCMCSNNGHYPQLCHNKDTL